MSIQEIKSFTSPLGFSVPGSQVQLFEPIKHPNIKVTLSMYKVQVAVRSPSKSSLLIHFSFLKICTSSSIQATNRSGDNRYPWQTPEPKKKWSDIDCFCKITIYQNSAALDKEDPPTLKPSLETPFFAVPEKGTGARLHRRLYQKSKFRTSREMFLSLAKQMVSWTSTRLSMIFLLGTAWSGWITSSKTVDIRRDKSLLKSIQSKFKRVVSLQFFKSVLSPFLCNKETIPILKFLEVGPVFQIL